MAKALKSAARVFVVTFLIVGAVALLPFTSTLTLTQVLTAASISGVGALVNGMMSKGINATSENFGSKVATRTATAPRQIIYGKARVGGTITHIETLGADNYKLCMIVVLAGHEVESLEEVLINDEILTTTSSGGFEYATNSKFVNADNENKFGVQSSLLRYVFVDGSQTTANTTVVNNTSLTSSDKFIGMSYMLIEMVFDSEAFGGGIPPMAFVVKGKKVYDPRTSSTAWSDNPALCVRDYITDTTYGLKATSSEVLDTTALGGFASAANTCDSGNTIGTATVNGAISSSTTVTVDTSSTLTLIDVGQTVTGTGISGTVKVVRRRGLVVTLSSAQTIADGVTLTFTEELYTANGITNMSASGSGVIEGLLSACAGKISYIDGKFVMFAGASVSPDMTITDDNLLAPISVTTKQSSGESFNTVKAVYVDANNNYVATDSPVYTDSTFLSNDTPTGESSANYRKTLELQLPFTDTTTMAQRLQRTALLHTRKEVSLGVLCNIAYMQLQPFDWVYFTNERLGYTNKTFEVLSTNLEVIESDDAPVLATRLALKEIDSSVYAFASSSYTSPIDEGTSVSTGSFSVTAPTNLSVSATLINTGYDLQVQWTNNPDDLIQGTEILYGTSSGTYIGSLIAGKGKTKEIIPNVKANSVYYIVARHFSANNVFSANTSEVNINTNSGTGIATPSAPTSLSATTGKPLSIGLSWSNPSSTDLRDIKIYRSTTSGFTPNDGTNLVRTIAGVPSVTQKVSFGVDDGLVENTNYYFKVKAVSFFDKVSSASGQATGSFTKVEATDINLPDFSGYFHKEGNTTTALTSAQFNTEYGRTPLNDDILIMVNTSSSPKTSKAYKWNGSSFVEITNFTTGDLVVDGTIAGDKLVANTITADEISTGTLTSASGVFGSISANDIDTGTLNAANVTVSGGDVTINNSGIAINGSSSSINLGSGAFTVSSSGVMTATGATISGEVNATSGTFNGSISIGSGNNIFKADTNGIYLGNTSYASALFKVSPAGVVQSDKRITSGTGTTQATLSGEDATYRFWSGGTSGSTADFSVSKTGEIIAKKISIYNNEGGLIFSSDAGFSDLALTQISAVTGTPVQSVSDTFSANGDTSASWQSITLVANTNLSVSVALNTLFGGDGFSNTSSALASADALAEIPDNFTLQMQYSSDGGSNWNNIAITSGGSGNSQQFTKTTSTNPTAQQYSVDITTESEPAFFVAFADVRKGNSLSNYGSVDANGYSNITGTITNLAGATGGTTYKFRTLVTTTDSGYNTINKVTATAPRTLTITDTSGSGFYIDNGDGSQTVPTGDITSVSITTASSSGLTGGQTFASGAANFTLALASSIDGNKTFNDEITADALGLPSQTPSTTTNKLYNVGGSLYFNGSAVGGGGTGDITAVTAGTNLNGGGTSGAVTLNLDNTISITGTITASGGNSTNWNTAYTVANAALPKAGGTMTGQLIINATVDNQILLTSPSSWTGIGFNDSAAGGTEYIWHNGTNGTFAIGGGGSNVANKKLHVDGGMTIGSSYDATAVSANSLNVQGTISSGAITSTGTSQFDRVKTGLGTVGSPAVQVGDTDSGFYDSGANEIGVSLSGVLEYEFIATQFDMKSNNLTGVGTINSGAITSSATSNFERFRLTDSSKMGFGTLKAGASIGHTASVDEGIFWHTSNGYGIYRTSGTWSSPNYQQLKLKFETGIEIDGNGTTYGKSGINFLNGNIKMDGTQILDAARNLSNIGTISQVGTVSLNSNSLSDPDSTSRTSYPAGQMLTHYSEANGVSIIGGQGGYTGCGLTIGEETGRSANFKLIRGISDTNGSPAEEFSIDGVGNAVFAGTISSGAITTSGTGTAGVPTLDIINSSSSTFNHSIEAIAPNMTSGETNILVVGQASSTKNSGYIGYYYVGAGSNSNFVSIGHWGADHLFRVYGDGTVRATTGAISSYGGGYDVSGTTVIDASRNLTNIGTISSGTITANGGGSQHEFISSSDAPLITRSTDATSGLGFVDNSSTNYIFYRGVINHFYTNSGTLGVGVASVGSGQALNVAGGIGISSTTVIDSSRNLTNIGSITTSGNFVMTKSQPYVVIQNTTEDGGGIVFNDSQAGAWPAASSQQFRMTYHSGNNSFIMGHDENSYTGFSFASGGNFTANGNVTAYSDERLKTNIQTLDSKKALQMRGVSFIKDGVEGSGVIAQEIEEIAPELVITANDEMGTKSVAYGNLVGYLIETVKDQQKQIDELKQRLDNDSSN